MSVADIILAVDEPIDATQCGGKENCHDDQKCITHDLWANLNQHIFDYLRRRHAEATGRRAESQAERRRAGARHARKRGQARTHAGCRLISTCHDARLFRPQRDHAARRARAGGDAAVSARAVRQCVEPARIRHAGAQGGEPGARAGRRARGCAAGAGGVHERRHRSEQRFHQRRGGHVEAEPDRGQRNRASVRGEAGAGTRARRLESCASSRSTAMGASILRMSRRPCESRPASYR